MWGQKLPFPVRCFVWFGLVWFGLVWFGLVWFGLVWFGFVVTKGQLQILTSNQSVHTCIVHKL